MGEEAIPLFLRSWACRAFQPAWAQFLGGESYRFVASRCARGFAKAPGIELVRWTGGAVDRSRCVPGLSDLDFQLRAQDPLNEGELILLRKRYRRLKRFYPILGEISLATTGEEEAYLKSKPASALDYNSYREWKSGKWSPLFSFSASDFSIQSRFSAALLKYVWAQKYYALSKRRGAYTYACLSFAREVKKVSRFSGQGESELASEPSARFFQAFYTLERLAKRAKAQTPVGKKLKLGKTANPDEKALWLGQAWLSSFEKRARPYCDSLSKTTVPFVYTVKNPGPGFFVEYCRALSLPMALPALFLSEEAFFLFQQGWGVVSPAANLGEKASIATLSETYRSIYDRAISLRHALLGQWVSVSSPTFVGNVRRLAHSALILASGLLSVEIEELIAECPGHNYLSLGARAPIEMENPRRLMAFLNEVDEALRGQ